MQAENKDSLIAKGGTAEVYAWENGQILKLFYDWCPPGWIQHEIEINQLLARSSLPVPKLVGTMEISNRRGIIYERVDGPSLIALLSTRPWLVAKHARIFAELHAEIHKCDGSGLKPLRASLRGTIEKLEGLPAPMKGNVLAVLEDLPDGVALCHFDFHPDQVLITSRGPVVIDWMTAFQGDPAADVARTEILLTVGQLPYGSLFLRTLINLVRGQFNRIYLSRYFELNPAVSRQMVGKWMAPVAAARLDDNIPGERQALLSIIQRLSYSP